MLVLKDIKKEYKVGNGAVNALKGISINFRDNEFVSILGPSGCGKTTLLNIIGGLDHATSGDVIIDGISTASYKDSDWDNYRNKRIGFVFQSYNLIPHQTVLENVELALTISGINKEKRVARSKEILDKVGLSSEIYKKPNQLSGGQCQRVAIARALVNDPEILLADEPTGALDSKSSVQVMDLLAEIAKNRLVIMVTHNPELAEKYSNRIVRLLDGELTSDSNPFDEIKEVEVKKEEVNKKSKLSFISAFKLSTKNLISKWKRTALVCFAGSIGIIGIGLVLSVSSGVNNYITSSEEDLLNSSPLTVSEKSYDFASLLESMSSMEVADEVIDHTEDGVIQVEPLIKDLIEQAEAFTNMEVKNEITPEYIKYAQDLNPDLYNSITLDYGIDVTNNIYTDVNLNTIGSKNMSLSSIVYMYSDMLSNTEMSDLTSLINEVKYPFEQITNGDEFLLSLYDVVATTDEEDPLIHDENELILVVDDNGSLSDLLLGQYGYYTQDEFFNRVYKALDDSHYNEDLDKNSFTYEELLNKEFTYYPNNSIYAEPALPSLMNAVKFNYKADSSEIEGEGTTLKIKSILKKKDGLNYAPLSSGIYYSSALTEKFINDNKNSEIVASIGEDETSQELDGIPSGVFEIEAGQDGQSYKIDYGVVYHFDYYLDGKHYENVSGYVGSSGSMLSSLLGGSTSYTITKRELGGYDVANRIEIYAKDFDCNDQIVTYLNKWNESGDITLTSGEVIKEDSRQEVKVTDNLSLIFDMVGMITTIVTIALVCFTALSLVVSTVMIAIITYISVIERVKEIGVIRSLGGRKRDVRNLFNAETFIIGGLSGVFGVAITYVLSGIINLIVGSYVGIYTIASLPFYMAIILILVSILLTAISGLIPANIAAKKDPAVALRTE